MTKVAPYSRLEFQRFLVSWSRRNVRVVAAVTVGASFLLAPETVLLLREPKDTRPNG